MSTLEIIQLIVQVLASPEGQAMEAELIALLEKFGKKAAS